MYTNVGQCAKMRVSEMQCENVDRRMLVLLSVVQCVAYSLCQDKWCSMLCVLYVGACMTFSPQAQARHNLKTEKKNDEVIIKGSFRRSKVQKSSTHGWSISREV